MFCVKCWTWWPHELPSIESGSFWNLLASDEQIVLTVQSTFTASHSFIDTRIPCKARPAHDNQLAFQRLSQAHDHLWTVAAGEWFSNLLRADRDYIQLSQFHNPPPTHHPTPPPCPPPCFLQLLLPYSGCCIPMRDLVGILIEMPTWCVFLPNPRESEHLSPQRFHEIAQNSVFYRLCQLYKKIYIF